MHRVLWLLATLFALSILSGCFFTKKRGSTEPIEISGTPTTGTNIRGVACSFKELGEALYDIYCRALVTDKDGNELTAIAPPPNTSLQWKDPVLVYGSPFEIRSCSVASDLLSQRCEVSVPDAIATLLRFDLDVTKVGASPVTQSGFVLLPLSLLSYGFNRLAPLTYNVVDPEIARVAVADKKPLPAGYSLQKLPPFSNLGNASSVCSVAGSIFFTTSYYIFRLQNGEVTLFAGNQIQDAKLAFPYEDRLRIPLYTPRISDCRLTSRAGSADQIEILVADSGRGQVLALSDDLLVQLVAGNADSTNGESANDGTLATATKIFAQDALRAPNGTLYFVEQNGTTGFRLRYVDSQNRLATLAVSSTLSAADPLTGRYSFVRRSDGTFFVAESRQVNAGLARIWSVQPNGTISLAVNTNNTGGIFGDGGPALAAQLGHVYDLAISSTDEIFIADSTHGRIRRIDPTTNFISTVAGSVAPVNSTLAMYLNSENQLATASTASIGMVRSIFVESDGSLLYSEYALSRVLRKQFSDAKLRRLIGDPTRNSEITGNAITTTLPYLGGVVKKRDGSILTAASFANRIYAIDENSKLQTVLGPEQAYEPRDIVLDGNEAIYFSEGRILNQGSGPQAHLIQKMATGTSAPVVFAGKLALPGFGGDGGLATAATLNDPKGLYATSGGVVYVADSGNNRIRKIENGIISTIAGGGNSMSEGVSALSASLSRPYGVSLDSEGTIYIADTGNYRIRQVKNGLITTIAGGPTATCLENELCDGIDATEVAIPAPTHVRPGPFGRIFFLESGRPRVRYLEPYLVNGLKKYRVRVLVGNSQKTTARCGSGQVAKRVSGGQAASEFAASLAAACIGQQTSFSIESTCDENPNGRFTMLFGQLFVDGNTFGSILRADGPCSALSSPLE